MIQKQIHLKAIRAMTSNIYLRLQLFGTNFDQKDITGEQNREPFQRTQQKIYQPYSEPSFKVGMSDAIDQAREPVPGTIPDPLGQKKEIPPQVQNPEKVRQGPTQGVYDTPDKREPKKPVIEENPKNIPGGRDVQRSKAATVDSCVFNE
ncbi:UNKNOWN [Stylonychia lemnae]|uniref:Uncharacterized protein n=1 Tax=Stylonychia lemnae TaxID=5949 RepID=A0A078A3U2_STYLE|nr:UNKNOWN [Stylonychia lemnae]|eukprot:CDW76521.1 UNKNOWN [Stylonychia lemnae]